MNNKVHITVCLGLALSITTTLKASTDHTPTDSISTSYNLHEVEVVSPMRSTGSLFLQPTSYTALKAADLQRYQLRDVTALTSRVPGLFIPDYGSKRSTAVYMRGSGSRTTGQTIGFYIDGVPVLKKELFNFDLSGIQDIEVLRGPQGTLYGLNAMSGIINLNTYSPFDAPRKFGVTIGAGNYNQQYINLEHRSKLSKHWGLGVQASASKRDGYFFNETRGREQDPTNQAYVATKLEYRPNDSFRIALSVDANYVDQGAVPYQTKDRRTGQILPIQSNDLGEYQRKALASRLRITKDGSWWRLESATGYQYLDDKMSMDMDQTKVNMFFVRQVLRQNAVSQELVFKSHDKASPYQWIFGAFGFYDNSTYSVPTSYKPAGIGMLQRMVDQKLAKTPPPMPITINVGTSPENIVASEFKKPEWGMALYHESSMRNFFVDGLTLTAGVRTDYSHQKFHGIAQGQFPTSITISGNTTNMNIPTNLDSQDGQGKWHILPKVALQYEGSGYNVYASFSQGFKSGGYNEQAFANSINQAFSNSIDQALQVKLKGASSGKLYDSAPLAATLAYKPELSWNYELGGRLNRLAFLSNLSLSLYYTHSNNTQVAKFVSSGVGRITSNVGTSNTYGAELAGDINIFGSLQEVQKDYIGLRLNGSYTHTSFKGEGVSTMDKKNYEVSGKTPFIPEFTYSVMLSANKGIGKMGANVFADLEVNGLGKTYWDQENTMSQDPYFLGQARLGFGFYGATIAFVGKNLFRKDYVVFQASNPIFGTSLQYGAPRTFGVELSYKL